MAACSSRPPRRAPTPRCRSPASSTRGSWARTSQGALRTALDDPAPDYSARAIEALAPFSREAVDRLVAEQLLPRLLA